MSKIFTSLKMSKNKTDRNGNTAECLSFLPIYNITN